MYSRYKTKKNLNKKTPYKSNKKKLFNKKDIYINSRQFQI